MHLKAFYVSTWYESVERVACQCKKKKKRKNQVEMTYSARMLNGIHDRRGNCGQMKRWQKLGWKPHEEVNFENWVNF